MAVKKAVKEEVKRFRCCGVVKTPENTTAAGKCKGCRDARTKVWRKEHPDRLKEINHKAAVKRVENGKDFEYRIKNRDALNERWNNYVSGLEGERLEQFKEMRREAGRRRYQRNRDEILAYQAMRRAQAKAEKHNASL